jgi:ABC-type multidrug transport system permease subunit
MPESKRRGPGRDLSARRHRDDPSRWPTDQERQHPLWELSISRMREFLREPEAVFWVFIFPVLLALALGIAFRNQPPEKARVAVVGRGPETARTEALLAKSPDLTVFAMTEKEAAAGLGGGKIDLALSPAAGDTGPTYLFRYDPTRPQSRAARLVAGDALQRALGRRDPAVIREQTRVEIGARYIDFLIPGLIGMNLMGSGMWGIGYNVVNARTRRLLKRMAVTPMRRPHFLLSFMFSRLLFLVLEVAALVGFAFAVFSVGIHGSVLAFVVVVLLGTQAFAGLGLLVAARSTSIEAVSGWINFVMLPMWLLSGTFFSYERFPAFTHPWIRLLPLTALNDALRAIMNDGAPLYASWHEVIVLAAWGILTFVVALRFFRWQ